MIIPPHNQLSFAAFSYGTGEEIVETPDGPQVVKIVAIKDNPSGLTMQFRFSKAEYQQFTAKLTDSRIVSVSSMPSNLIKDA